MHGPVKKNDPDANVTASVSDKPTVKRNARSARVPANGPSPQAKVSPKAPAKVKSDHSGGDSKPTTSKPRTSKPSQATPAKSRATRAKPARSKLTRAQTEELFSRFARIEPEPKGELAHVNAFTLLVAVLLSAQATDAGVNKATAALFHVADTPEKMLALGEDAVRDYIKTIGLYRNKAKNVIALSRRLIDDFGGTVPQDRDALETLPGVGRKTANVVMNMAFGQPTMAVDTHVFRVANRIGLAPGKTPDDVERGLDRVVPAAYGLHAHHWLILHGRYLCKARKPACAQCPVFDLCRYKDKTASTSQSAYVRSDEGASQA